jgi:steroid 5-alpha reductase family enzyme
MDSLHQVWLVSIPLTVLNSPAVSDINKSGSNPTFGTATDVVGLVLWSIGWLTESIADWQKVCNAHAAI